MAEHTSFIALPTFFLITYNGKLTLRAVPYDSPVYLYSFWFIFNCVARETKFTVLALH
jgi:hypothetical protein